MIPTRFLISKGSKSVAFRSIQRKIASASNNCTEIEIKVPWGIIAGKLWNPNETQQPILALHGWHDNAASFDNLVPLLPKKTSILAIDLPGHGLSSWLPEGVIYSRFMYIQVIHRIRKHFGWDKIGLIGHSLGGMFSFSYSALYPESVKFVTALDFYTYFVQKVHIQALNTSKELTAFLELEKLDKPTRSFTEEQTIAKLIQVTQNSLDESACRALMVRGVKKDNNGNVTLSRDPRTKFLHLTASFNDQQLKEKSQLIKAPYLILKADDWHYNGNKSGYYECIETLKKSSADLRFFKVPGKHHFHMTNPQNVADLMIPFLDQYN